MARDFWLGKSKKNFAIQGHPPAGSYEYDFIRGLPATRAPELPRRKAKSEAQAVYDSLGSVAAVSDTDFDAASRWMSNLAEKISAKSSKKLLDDRDLDTWSDLWKQWLLLGAKVKTDNTPATLKPLLMNPLMMSTLPFVYMARKLSAGVMSEATKREYDRLLCQAFALYRVFRIKGLEPVAIPYMSDIVVMLKTLPEALTLKQMVVRMREAAKAGDRLLDQNAPWWNWKALENTTGLRRAISAALDLSDKFEATSKLKGQDGLREKGSFAYDLFLQAVTKIPIEIAALYQVEETIKAVKEGPRNPEENQVRRTKSDIVTLGIVSVLGYLGWKWWTKPETTSVVDSFKLEYHPDLNKDNKDDFQVEGDEEA